MHRGCELCGILGDVEPMALRSAGFRDVLKVSEFLRNIFNFFLHYADLNKRNLNVKERIKMLITSHLNNSKRCISSDLQIGFAMH